MIVNLLAKLTGDATNVVYTCELPPKMATIRRLRHEIDALINSHGYGTTAEWKVYAVAEKRKTIAALEAH